MSKWSKRISLILVIIIGFVLLRNLFTKPDKDQNSTYDYSHIYESKTSPVGLAPQNDTYTTQSPKDEAFKYASLWKFPEIYAKSSEHCLENYYYFHPTVAVQRDKTFEYYGIKIGTEAWDELVAAYEKQAVNVCYSYSGLEIEDSYASVFRVAFTKSELRQILDFYNTDIGKKVIRVSYQANQNLLKEVSKKQNDAVSKETLHFNNQISDLYLKYLEEDGGWFERTWYKLFSE